MTKFTKSAGNCIKTKAQCIDSYGGSTYSGQVCKILQKWDSLPRINQLAQVEPKTV